MRIILIVNLKGGDVETLNGDLKFQIHDANNSDAIIATANFAAIGSKNTPGTDSANLTFIQDDLGFGGLGQMTIQNVDVGSSVAYKVKVKDSADNESIISNFSVYLDENNVFSNQKFRDTNSDGQANDIVKFNSPIMTISTGNGHDKNAQKCEEDAIAECFFYPNGQHFIAAHDYEVTYYYRAKGDHAREELVSAGLGIDLAENLGDAIKITRSLINIGTPGATNRFYPSKTGGVSGDWLEISNLVIKDVT